MSLQGTLNFGHGFDEPLHFGQNRFLTPIQIDITIIMNLMKILSSFSSKDPFINNNIRSFRIIGYSILIMGIGDAIIRYPLPNNTGVEIMATSHGSLKPIFLLYVTLSILALILADVFKMAVEIKEDNDLTI